MIDENYIAGLVRMGFCRLDGVQGRGPKYPLCDVQVLVGC